jgi:putative transposase
VSAEGNMSFLLKSKLTAFAQLQREETSMDFGIEQYLNYSLKEKTCQKTIPIEHRKMRITNDHFQKGHFYHLWNHAAGEKLLFADEDDYLRCLSTFRRYYEPHSFAMVAYCLMPNHYHILIRQNSADPVYMLINRIWASYSRYYNKKYEKWGSIFSTKLQHKIMEDDTQLLQTCIYIHNNPREAGLVEDLSEWKWSNYLEWIDLRSGVLFCKDVRDSFFSRTEVYAAFMKVYKTGQDIIIP